MQRSTSSVLNYMTVKEGDDKLLINRVYVKLKEKSEYLPLELNLEGLDKEWIEKEGWKRVKECWI